MVTTMMYSEAFPSDPMRQYFFDLKQGHKGHIFLQISCSEKQRDGSYLRNRIVIFLRDLPLVVQALSSICHHAAFLDMKSGRLKEPTARVQQMPGLSESPLPDPALKPIERMRLTRAVSLADEELVSLLFSAGLTDEQSLELSRSVLAGRGGLAGLAKSTAAELKTVAGIGEIRSSTILAVVEIARRLTPVGLF